MTTETHNNYLESSGLDTNTIYATQMLRIRKHSNKIKDTIKEQPLCEKIDKNSINIMTRAAVV